MIVAHSAHWGWKSCACDGTPQVVIGIAVSPGKMRAGEPEDGLDVWSGFALREQISGDPQIHDAPVRLRKAFENMPSQHTTPVDRGSFCHAGGGKLSGGRVDVEPRVQVPGRVCILPEGLQQPQGVWRQTHTGVHEFDPRSVTVRCASCGLLIGEPGEASQVMPVGAGPIASVQARHVLAGRSRHCRFHRRGTEANPDLQMARAGLQHHTRVMPVGAHPLHDRWMSAIQVDENIAGVLVSSIGLDVDVASLTVANAQEADGSRMHQLGRCPKSFSRKRTVCLVVNQTDQIQLVRHRRKLATDGLPGQKQSSVVHDRNFAIKPTRRTMNSQRTANSVLTLCLSRGDNRSIFLRTGRASSVCLARKWIANCKPIDRLAISHVLRVKYSSASMERSRDNE